MSTSQQVQPQPQVIIVKHEHGCLVPLLITLCFGWVGLGVYGLWKLTKLSWHLTVWAARISWRWCVAYPVQWSWVASVWTYRATVRGIRAATPWVRTHGPIAMQHAKAAVSTVSARFRTNS